MRKFCNRWLFAACVALIGPVAVASQEGLAAAEREGLEAAADPALYLQLIRGMQQKALYYASLAHLDAFDARWPDRGEAQLLRAHALRETGANQAAAEIYRRLESGSFAAEASHGLGLIAMRERRQDDGLAALARAVRLAPTSTALLNDLGYARLLAGDLAGARQSLYRAAELDAGSKRVGANLALLLLLEGREDAADGVMRRYQLSDKARADIRALAAARAGEAK